MVEVRIEEDGEGFVSATSAKLNLGVAEGMEVGGVGGVLLAISA